MSDTSTEAAKKIDHCDSWYYHDVKELPAPTLQLFEEYSGVPSEQVIDHIQKMVRFSFSVLLVIYLPEILQSPYNHSLHIVVDLLLFQRSRAFEIYPYPCIGQLRFLNLSLSCHPLYPEVLSRLRLEQTKVPQHQSLSMDGQNSGIYYQHQHPQYFLDLGCCLAQDLRKLVFDGVPSENLHGLDIEEGFIKLSYDLFRDHDTFKSRFLVEDMFLADGGKTSHEATPSTNEAPTSPHAVVPLASINNRMSIIAANSFFHLYNYSDQLKLAKRVVQLLSPDRGSLILGRQIGSSVPGEYTAVNNKGTRYSHDVASFRHFWWQVAKEIGHGCSFRVEATLDEEELGENKNKGQHWAEPNIRRLRFGVWRE